MNCRFERELLSMYADGALRRDRLLYVESHVAGCVECGAIVQEIRHIGNALSSLPNERAPKELVERIVMSTRPIRNRSAWEAARWTAGAVAKVALNGFAIDDELEAKLRRESPEWVARWVLFV